MPKFFLVENANHPVVVWAIRFFHVLSKISPKGGDYDALEKNTFHVLASFPLDCGALKLLEPKMACQRLLSR